MAFAEPPAVSRYSTMISGVAPPACSSTSKSSGWIRNRAEGESEAAICASFTGPCTSSSWVPEWVRIVRTSPARNPCCCSYRTGTYTSPGVGSTTAPVSSTRKSNSSFCVTKRLSILLAARSPLSPVLGRAQDREALSYPSISSMSQASISASWSAANRSSAASS